MIKKFTNKIYKNYMWSVFIINNIKPLFSYKKFSYSDFNEDLLIGEILGSNMGSYVDIGAGHPIIGSNTYYFYKQGWQGITVEPIRFHSLLHRIARKRDTNIHKLIGEDNVSKKFYEFNPTQYSTNSEEQYRIMTNNGMQERRTYYLDSISVNQVLMLVDGNTYFLSIDCEGYDATILKSIDWELIKKPKVIVFEKINNKQEFNEVETILSRNNYLRIHTTELNFIYSLQV